MKRVYSAKLSPKSQITIPAKCLRELGWVKDKSRLVRTRVRGGMLITPVTGSGPAASKEGTSQ